MTQLAELLTIDLVATNRKIRQHRQLCQRYKINPDTCAHLAALTQRQTAARILTQELEPNPYRAPSSL